MKTNKNQKKQSFLSEAAALMILLGLAASILDFLSPILPFLIGAIIIGTISYVCVKLSKKSPKKSEKNNPSPVSAETNRTQNESIKRQIEILTDSINLVNESADLDTVLHRYDLALETLQKISDFTEAELTTMGFHLKEPLTDTLQKMQNNKTQLFNQAITRNLQHDIDSVKKNETKAKKIIQFRNKYENNPSLSPKNKSFLIEQCNTNIAKYAPQNYTQINSIDHTVKSIALSADGSFAHHEKPDDFIKRFYELSSAIDSKRDVHERIDACEKSYPLLKEFCRFCIENDGGELPHRINCRDAGPELYMRLGRWPDVERVIQICSEANAYYPDNDDKIWTYYGNYKRIANLAVAYIQNNPGCLQNKIYSALNVADDDREILKHFLRCSLQIRKEPQGKTNRLYVADPLQTVN